MSIELAQVLCLLAGAIVMFAVNKPRMDVVALVMMTALPLTGVITMPEALAGFSDSNIVLIAALFVIGEGLVRTGVARRLGDLLISKAGKSETRLLVLLMVSVCGLGAFMSSTAVTAIFIPVALRIAFSTGSSPGRLMMPLSFAALISGMMTLVATAPNLVVSSELVRQGHKPFGFFSITPFGIPILVLGVAYMLFARRWLRGSEEGESATPKRRASLADWVQEYDLAGREHRLQVLPGSPLAGKTLADIGLRSTEGVNIIAVERDARFAKELIQPSPRTELQAGDVLLIDLRKPETDLSGLRERLGLQPLPLAGAYFNDRTQDIGMAQAIVPADSPLIGKSLIESGFRSKTGLTVIGLRRGTEAIGQDLLSEELRIGDTLLLVGPWKQIERIQPDETGILILRLPVEVEDVLPAPGKAAFAVAILCLVVALMVTGIVPNVQAALIGCLLMGAFGCIDLTSGYRSISWKTIILIVGMLPFSLALQRTGGVDIAAKGMMALTGGAGPHAILVAIFALTAILGMFMSNTATAVLMAPIAIAVAYELDMSPYPFAMIVALAASTAFVTPVSSPVNTLVVTPGNYRFGDFVKVGGPFAVVVMIVSVVLVPIFLPLKPSAAEPAPAPALETTHE